MANSDDFMQEFCRYYLKVGIGSMTKRDIDSLVMHLIDNYGYYEEQAGKLVKGIPLGNYPNQTASERLRVPVSKIRTMRYEAGLKYGGPIEKKAKTRLLIALDKAAFEADGLKIRLVIEDSLARNWLQGQLKENNAFFDSTFNREVTVFEADDLFNVLSMFFDKTLTRSFKKDYEAAVKKKKYAELKVLVKQYVAGAAKKAGGLVVTAAIA